MVCVRFSFSLGRRIGSHTRTYAHINACARTFTHTPAHARAHTCACARTHTYPLAHAPTHAHACEGVHTRAHTHTRTLTDTPARTGTHTQLRGEVKIGFSIV